MELHAFHAVPVPGAFGLRAVAVRVQYDLRHAWDGFRWAGLKDSASGGSLCEFPEHGGPVGAVVDVGHTVLAEVGERRFSGSDVLLGMVCLLHGFRQRVMGCPSPAGTMGHSTATDTHGSYLDK